MRPRLAAVALLASLAAACSAGSASEPATADASGNEASGGDGGRPGDDAAGPEAGPGDASPESAPVSCTTDSDCSGGLCGFPTAAGCSAKGTCFPNPGAVCQAYSPGCGCDARIVNIVCNGLPSGYAPTPILYPEECIVLDATPGG